jgi:hypothetical protein
MIDRWFYVAGEQTIGPEPFENLLAILGARDDWQSLLVWRDGYTDWRRAGGVPEISLYLKKPPPIPKPSIPPRAFTRTTPKATPWNDIPPKADASPIASKTNPVETDQGANHTDDQKPKKKLTSRLLAVLSFFAIFVAAVIGHSIGKPIGREVSNAVLGSGRSAAEQIESGLIQAENTVRPTLPKQLDDYTTWVAINHTGRTLQYEYLVDLQGREISATFSSDLKAQLLPNICSAMDKMLERGVTMEYNYRNRMYAPVGSFTVTWADCKARS